MSENRTLADNVLKFLGRASVDYGRIKSEQFSQDMYCDLLENELGSPIEELFSLAVHVLSAAHYFEVNPDPVFNEGKDAWEPGYGLHVSSQYKIGKYRVDFLIQSMDGPQPNQVVVELDGHAFHDKDKNQRAYEKARDRFLVANGYRVLHFTGSEVVADPYKVAHEALDIIGVIDAETYDPANPFGID